MGLFDLFKQKTLSTSVSNSNNLVQEIIHTLWNDKEISKVISECKKVIYFLIRELQCYSSIL